MLASFVFGAVVAAQAAETIARCREAHAADPPSHIACLEQAMRAQAGEMPDPTPSLGLEQVEQKSKARETSAIHVQIVSAQYGADGLGVFELADGQIWKETEKTPSHQRLEHNQRYNARIEPGLLGGYRMYVEGIRRMIKVRRVK